MPHPEREHSLQIEVARLRREVEIATNGWVAEKARSDLYAAEARGLELTLATAESALAAARRECEGLHKLLSDARPWVHQLYRMQDCHAETAPEATKILRTLRRIDAALAAPAAGEEAKR